MTTTTQKAPSYIPLAIYGSLEQLDPDLIPDYVPKKFYNDYQTAVQFLLAYYWLQVSKNISSCKNS